MSFTIAMNAIVSDIARHCQSRRCMVVTHSWATADYLTVADTGFWRQPLPVALSSQSTLVGRFLRRNAPGVEVFTLSWDRPTDINIGQTFLPAMGELTLDNTTNIASLYGRYSTQKPSRNRAAVAEAFTFEIQAEYMKWDGELLKKAMS